MYYCYLRKLDKKRYLGFCNVLTGLYLAKLDSLFSLFENIIEILANKGSIVHYAENGELTTSIQFLYKNSEDVALVSQKLNSSFSFLSQKAKQLPPIDFSVAVGSTVTFSVNDDNLEVVKASYTFSNTFIYKDNDYNTIQINSYKGVLNRINNENIELRKKNQYLRDENTKILRQKKQFKNVIVLILAVIGCSVGIYFLYNNLNDTQNQLAEANLDIATKTEQIEDANRKIVSKDSTISVRNENISSLNKTIVNLNDTVNKYKTYLEEETAQRMEAEEKFNSYRSTLYGYQPFIVIGTSFEFSSGKYKINYYGLVYGNYTFKFKVVTPNNKVEVFEKSFYVYAGINSATVTLSRNFDNSKYYTIQIEYNNHVIGGSRH